MDIAEKIRVGRDIVAIIGLPLLVWRIWLLKNTFEQDHERSRNQKAADIIREWTKSLNYKSSVARKLVETFDFETCKKLHEQKDFTIKVDDELKSKYLKVILDKKDDIPNGECKIEVEDSIKLRWEIITYLNTLESVLVSYRHNVANNKIIKEQFKYLVRPQDNHFILQTYRTVSGTTDFPAIADFTEELKKYFDTNTPGQPPTGRLNWWCFKRKKK